jgi:hypothetical protein
MRSLLTKTLLIFILTLTSVIFGVVNSVSAAVADTQIIEGVITKIEAKTVTVVVQGRDIVIEKKFVPKDQLKPGKFISVEAEIYNPKK